jgi:hypothetical protein
MLALPSSKINNPLPPLPRLLFPPLLRLKIDLLHNRAFRNPPIPFLMPQEHRRCHRRMEPIQYRTAQLKRNIYIPSCSMPV